MDEKEKIDLDDSICDVPGLVEIRNRPDIVEGIRWDVTPENIMEPRFQSNPEDLKKLREITGYMFYIETQCEPPALMLMKVGKTDISSTIGKIEEVPQELVRRAIENPVQKPSFGMYAISEEIKDWLKKELGLK